MFTRSHLVSPAPETPPKGAERNLLDAIERLRAGAPIDRGLQIKARARKLKVNATTATIEASCARRLAYAFPRVRQALGIDREPELSETGTPVVTGRKSLQEIVTQLRADNAELKRERDRAMSAAASLVIRLRDLEMKAGNEIRKVERKASRAERPYQVTGSVTRLFPRKEEVE